MAKQIGVIRLTGMVDDLVLYNHPDDGPLARKKSYVTGEKVKTSPEYAHTMANAAEFATALRGAQFLRKTMNHLLFPIADGKLSSRMNRVMLEMVQQDRVNPGGERVVHEGNPMTLQGFEFNRHISLKESFWLPVSVQEPSGDGQIHLDVPSFIPAKHIQFADYVKEIRLVSGAAVVDFQKQGYKNSFWETEMIPLNKEPVEPIRFSYPMAPGPGQVLFLLLGIQHFAKVDELPKDAISKRKYWQVRKWRNSAGLTAFTGALSILKVIPGEARPWTPSNEWDVEGLGLA